MSCGSSPDPTSYFRFDQSKPLSPSRDEGRLLKRPLRRNAESNSSEDQCDQSMRESYEESHKTFSFVRTPMGLEGLLEAYERGRAADVVVQPMLGERGFGDPLLENGFLAIDAPMEIQNLTESNVQFNTKVEQVTDLLRELLRTPLKQYIRDDNFYDLETSVEDTENSDEEQNNEFDQDFDISPESDGAVLQDCAWYGKNSIYTPTVPSFIYYNIPPPDSSQQLRIRLRKQHESFAVRGEPNLPSLVELSADLESLRAYKLHRKVAELKTDMMSTLKDGSAVQEKFALLAEVHVDMSKMLHYPTVPRVIVPDSEGVYTAREGISLSRWFSGRTKLVDLASAINCPTLVHSTASEVLSTPSSALLLRGIRYTEERLEYTSAKSESEVRVCQSFAEFSEAAISRSSKDPLVRFYQELSEQGIMRQRQTAERLTETENAFFLEALEGAVNTFSGINNSVDALLKDPKGYCEGQIGALERGVRVLNTKNCSVFQIPEFSYGEECPRGSALEEWISSRRAEGLYGSKNLFTNIISLRPSVFLTLERYRLRVLRCHNDMVQLSLQNARNGYANISSNNYVRDGYVVLRPQRGDYNNSSEARAEKYETVSPGCLSHHKETTIPFFSMSCVECQTIEEFLKDAWARIFGPRYKARVKRLQYISNIKFEMQFHSGKRNRSIMIQEKGEDLRGRKSAGDITHVLGSFCSDKSTQVALENLIDFSAEYLVEEEGQSVLQHQISSPYLIFKWHDEVINAQTGELVSYLKKSSK